MASTKLRFPPGTSRTFLLRFLRPDLQPEDLTAATYAAYIKASLLDADAAALVDLSARVATYDALAGLAILRFLPADTAELDPFAAPEWQVRATLADGRVLAHEEHSGPIVFPPLVGRLGVSDPPNAYLEPIVNMSPYVSSITGLTGGTAAKLDGLSASALAGMPNATQIDLFFAGSIAARYRIRDRGASPEVPAAAGGFFIHCDNDAARGWELVSVQKDGVPCVWNPDTARWHQLLAYGAGAAVAVSIMQGADGFSLPA